MSFRPMFKRYAVFVALAVLLLPICAFAKSEQDILLAGHKTVYWQPKNSGQGKLPLILFSHGFKGCATQTTFLMEALAADGYWVFAPNHDDALCGHGTLMQRAERSFSHPDTWNDTTYADRADDMRDVLDALQHDPNFKDRIDFSSIGLVGHSLGGYTVLGLGGAWPSWKMPGVKAVLALSPYSAPFDEKHTLSNLKAAVMYQGGTRDTLITPELNKDDGSYEQTSTQSGSPKYFVEFDRANHLAWTDINHEYRASIIAYSTAFLDHYVKGLPATPALKAMRSDVMEMKYDSDLGKMP